MTLKALSKMIFNLVQELNISVTETSIFLELEKHPQQFSMLAINEILNTFQVNNGAYQVKTSDLHQDLCPFISHISRNDGEFVLVKQVLPDSVVVSSDRASTEVLKRETFDGYFTGSILIADDENKSEEPNYKAKKRSETVERLKIPFLMASFLFIFLLYFFQNINHFKSFIPLVILWEFIKILGLTVTVLLLVQNLDANNSFIKKICSKGKRTDCNAILSSKAAKVTDELSWSEVGFFYFSSTVLILLFYGKSISVLQLMSIVNILCLPYTVYSIYYQYSIAKKWCMLCIVTQLILWLEFFISIPFLFQPLLRPSMFDVFGIIILFILPISIWVFLKPLFLSRREINAIKNQLNSFKSNAELFNSVLVAQGRSGMPEQDFSIILGAKEPKKIITIVSNPTCTPCSKTHKLLDKWLNADETLQVRMVYQVAGESKESTDYRVARQISALKLTKSDCVREAVNEWYGQSQPVDSWIHKFPSEGIEEAEAILIKQTEWCDKLQISFTPTIFINGYKLPELYRIEDIRYLI